MEASLDREKKILSALVKRFPAVDAPIAALRTRRVYASVGRDAFLGALEYLAREMNFDHLCTITGLDTGERFEFLYHVSEPGGVVVTLKYQTERGDGVHIPSVLPIYNGATFYEREVSGLLGVTIDGLPEGRQYPLPDNWPAGEYPMRKDWKPGPRAFQPDLPPERRGEVK